MAAQDSTASGGGLGGRRGISKAAAGCWLKETLILPGESLRGHDGRI